MVLGVIRYALHGSADTFARKCRHFCPEGSMVSFFSRGAYCVMTYPLAVSASLNPSGSVCLAWKAMVMVGSPAAARS